jgi:hypothetical protein
VKSAISGVYGANETLQTLIYSTRTRIQQRATQEDQKETKHNNRKKRNMHFDITWVNYKFLVPRCNCFHHHDLHHLAEVSPQRQS